MHSNKFKTFCEIKSISISNLNTNRMNKEQAKKVLMMLNRINQEIDIIGNAILNKNLKPIPVRVKSAKFK